MTDRDMDNAFEEGKKRPKLKQASLFSLRGVVVIEELQRQNVKILFYEEGVLHAFGPMVPLQEFATYQPWFELGNFGVLDTMAERFAPMELSLELFVVPKECAWCSNVAVRKRCSRCNTYYCGAVCQSSDWPCHRMICKARSFNGGVA